MADQVRHLLIATHSLTQKIMNSRVHVCDPEKFLNTNYSPQHFWVSCLNHTRQLFNWSIVMLIEKTAKFTKIIFEMFCQIIQRKVFLIFDVT